MRFSTRLTGLLVAFALLTAVFADAGAGTASAGSGADRAAAGISKGRVAGSSVRQARHKRKLARTAGKHAVANNIGLTSGPQPSKAKASAAPAPAGLLFNGSRISDFALMQAAPGAIQEVPDPVGSGEPSLQMTVNDHDVAPITPTDNPRAQLLSPPLIENGDEFWLSTKFLIPQNFPSAKGWMSLMEIHGPPFNGSSPWQIEVVNGKLQWMRNGTYHWDVPWQVPLVKGSWVNVLLHERFASDGFVEMWINGQPVSFFGRETRLAMKTMDSSNNGGANSAKIMQYREEGMFESASVFFGALKLGLTREAVGG